MKQVSTLVGLIIIILWAIFALGGAFTYQYYTIKDWESKNITGLINTQLSATQNAFNWEGHYQLYQFAPPDEGWEYNLFILSNEGKRKLQLDVDGYQTMIRINATANNVGNSLDIVFDSYNTESEDIDSIAPKLWKKGDVLFTLTPVQSGLAVEWKKMESNLLKPKPEDNIFKKIN